METKIFCDNLNKRYARTGEYEEDAKRHEKYGFPYFQPTDEENVISITWFIRYPNQNVKPVQMLLSISPKTEYTIIDQAVQMKYRDLTTVRTFDKYHYDILVEAGE